MTSLFLAALLLSGTTAPDTATHPRIAPSWSRDGRTWESMGRLQPLDAQWRQKQRFGGIGSVGRFTPSLDRSTAWHPAPMLLDTASPFEIAGVGTLRWSGTYWWSGPDSLWAIGVLSFPDSSEWGKSTTEIMIEALLPDSVLKSRSPVQGPAIRHLRTAPLLSLPLGTGRLVSVRPIVLDGHPANLHPKVHILPWGHASEDDSVPSGRPWFWSDGQRIRSVRSIGILPTVRLGIDTGIAPVLSRKGGMTFAVDSVEPVLTRLPPLSDSAWRCDFGGWNDSGWLVGNPGTASLVETSGQLHAFAQTFVSAWNEHRPVRLSPDAAWMALLENLVLRIRTEPEACRGQMVLHDSGKVDLRVPVGQDFPSLMARESTWPPVVAALLDSMDRHVKGGRNRLVLPTFTTTTPTRAMATRLRVLELYKEYFNYAFGVGCGIPRITLEGTPDDWRTVRDRTKALATCGLEPWLARIVPVLDEFVRASEGKPSLDFWRSFVRFTPSDGNCGSVPTLDGWITVFFPVRKDGTVREVPSSIDPYSVAGDRGEVPFKVIIPGASTLDLSFTTGFSGVGQASDGALFPELGWSVRKNPLR